MGSSAETRRVLIVDDDPDLIALMRDGLELAGNFQVEVAADGAAGLERCLANRPTCVVVDVRLPALNGYQFMRALRGDPATADVPIIVLSALVQDRERLAGMLACADVYLFKPVRIADLVGAINDIACLTAHQRSERRCTLTGDGSIEVRTP